MVYRVASHAFLLLALMTVGTSCTEQRDPPRPVVEPIESDDTAAAPLSPADLSNQKLLGQDRASAIQSVSNSGLVLSTQTSYIDSNYEVLQGDLGKRVYLRGNQVVSVSRSPEKNEKHLLYWRYRFSGKRLEEKPIQDAAREGHQASLIQMTCDEAKMGVVFDPTQETVLKVFYYDQH